MSRMPPEDRRDWVRLGLVRHTCRYEPPERRVLPCQGCEEERQIRFEFPAELTRSPYAVLRDEVEHGPLPPGAAVQRIHDHVRMGRITAGQGADLLQLREELRLARRPWYVRALHFLWRLLCGG